MDTILDPFVGWLSDSLRTKWGRRKPFLFIGAPINSIFYFLLFSPPVLESGYNYAVWFGIFFSLYLIAPLSIPYHALAPELTLKATSRNSLYCFGEFFEKIGILLAAILPGLLIELLSDTRKGYFIMGLSVGLFMIVSFALLLLFVEEPTAHKEFVPPIIPCFRRAWRIGPFRILLLTIILGSIGHTCANVLFPFYITYVLRPSRPDFWLTIVLFSFFSSSGLSIPFWNWLSTRSCIDTRQCWLLGWAIHIPIAFSMFFLGQGDIKWFVALAVFQGLSFGGSNYLYKVIQAITIDYDELNSGHRREGIFITFWALIPKLVSIPSAAIPLLLLEKNGYVPNQQPQEPSVLLTIRILTTLVPSLLSFCALLTAFYFPINYSKQKLIGEYIKMRRNYKNSEQQHDEVMLDPLTDSPLPPINFNEQNNEKLFWFVDHFSKNELKSVIRFVENHEVPYEPLRKKMKITIIITIIFLSLLSVTSICTIILGDNYWKVFGSFSLSLCLTMLLFYILKLNSILSFTDKMIDDFYKNSENFFKYH